jgi:hypothetical protein
MGPSTEDTPIIAEAAAFNVRVNGTDLDRPVGDQL